MSSVEAEGREGRPTIRPLHLLTTDILLADLISGRTIATSEGHSLTLGIEHARSALDWYRRNRPKWAGNVTATDCEALIDSIATTPPSLPAPGTGGATNIKHLKLVRLVAHRFAGLHAYGTAADAPADFIFEPDKPITLFEGWNGSGKTSLANAIIWGLTGQLLRPQRLPEAGDKEFDCVVERGNEEPSNHAISPVTPLPHAQDWTPGAAAKVIPADTWVELTFADTAAGTLLPPVRRTQSRKPNGKLTETAPDPSVLGIDPIAFRLGTTMPGILPFLQIGSSSELGVAIARLTGLADLVELARHAGRASTRVGGAIVAERQQELERIESDFIVHRTDLAKRIDEFPAMLPEGKLPSTGEEDVAGTLIRLVTHFDRLKANGLADARSVLGESFDPENAGQRKDLEDCVGPAIEQLRLVRTLPSIDQIGKLKLDDKSVTSVRELLATLRNEAAELAELAANATLAKRTQLYARVAIWMAEHEVSHDDNCPVCRHSLLGVIDPETGTSVADHLAQLREGGGAVAKAIGQWASDWSGTLARDLPEQLRLTLARDLPASPAALLRTGLCDELFGTEPFSGTLAALRPLADTLIDKGTARLPPFVEPEIIRLPERVSVHATALTKTVSKIERALAFSDWMAANPGAMRAALDSVRGTVGDGSDICETGTSLSAKLARLSVIVTGVAPIGAAAVLVQRMRTSLDVRTQKIRRIAACRDTARALDAIVPVGALAQDQVEGLRRQLHDRAEYWRDQIYQNASSFSPRPQASGMNAQGVIDIHVGRGAVQAPAQHVANASALRAALMGFYLAFREHVLATSGGMTTLVLDDPQDLLDYDNRQRLARAISQLANDGAQIVATTHDRSFARTVVQEARGADLIAHRAVHPVNVSRATLETSLAVDELDRKRQAFVANVDGAPKAQDYANEARIFIEARLGDLFDDPAYPAHSAPTRALTLVPLFDRLRALVGTRSNELFKSPILAAFSADPAMASGAEARRILNQSHHDKASISYVDVERIDADVKRLRVGVERVHGEFRRYRWREPLTTEAPNNVAVLNPVQAPAFNVSVSQDIAAFTGHLPSGGSQAEDDEQLSSTWFDDKALFYIRHDTMGFAVPAGSVAIVEAAAGAVGDHSLVVARRGTQAFARRLLRPRNSEGFSLAAEATDPRRSRPTLAFEDHGISTHRVVGVLFSQLPPPGGREEATEISGDPILARIEVAYRVREESAVPLALPDQTILGGRILTTVELDRMEGSIVALTLSDGTSVLKRVGSQVSSALPYLRQFETIGALGKSTVIAVEAIEGAPDVPVMACARPVIGVIYNL